MNAVANVKIEFGEIDIESTFTCTEETVNQLMGIINNKLDEKIKRNNKH